MKITAAVHLILKRHHRRGIFVSSRIGLPHRVKVRLESATTLFVRDLPTRSESPPLYLRHQISLDLQWPRRASVCCRDSPRKPRPGPKRLCGSGNAIGVSVPEGDVMSVLTGAIRKGRTVTPAYDRGRLVAGPPRSAGTSNSVRWQRRHKGATHACLTL